MRSTARGRNYRDVTPRNSERASHDRRGFMRRCGVATEQKPASFHSSPQDAMQSAAEEFLYLACLHEGTGVGEPDFLAVVDAEEGRIVHETAVPTVGDELHHFGWNRCSS